MEILITESQLRVLLKEEYTEKIFQQLVDKFKQEVPNEDVSDIEYYIKRFDHIKNGPNITNKDITKYTFDELVNVVVKSVKNLKPKSYKGDTALDLVYQKDGVEVYVSDEKEKCIKYGDGYNFCISSHGDDNLYSDYRYDNYGTPYFIFNRNLESSKDEEYTDENVFYDPGHLLVLFIYQKSIFQKNKHYYQDFVDHEEVDEKTYENMEEYYSISDADNNGEHYYISFDSIEKNYPWLTGLKDIFKHKDLSDKDKKIVAIEAYGEAMLGMINRGYKVGDDECSKSFVRYTHYSELFKVVNDNIWGYNKWQEYLEAYNDGIRKSHVVMKPGFVDDKLGHQFGRVFFGDDYQEDANKFINHVINYYKHHLEGGTFVFGAENLYSMNIMIKPENYKIIECDWTPEFIDYMSKINALVNKITFTKYKISKGE